MAAIDRRAVLRAQIGRVDDVFHGNRQTVQRSAHRLRVERGGLTQCVLALDCRPRMDQRIAVCDARETRCDTRGCEFSLRHPLTLRELARPSKPFGNPVRYDP
jgi:hypothetical protein